MWMRQTKWECGVLVKFVGGPSPWKGPILLPTLQTSPTLPSRVVGESFSFLLHFSTFTCMSQVIFQTSQSFCGLTLWMLWFLSRWTMFMCLCSHEGCAGYHVLLSTWTANLWYGISYVGFWLCYNPTSLLWIIWDTIKPLYYWGVTYSIVWQIGPLCGDTPQHLKNPKAQH